MEGAGVRLRRVFGYHELPLFDPFLLLDNFGSKNPEDYIRGFPWHPHRGIETVTYVLEGEVEHQDSIGNKGVIGSGDVQWMTAGSGIIHQEMPRAYEGTMRGFQLWVNLPAEKKMVAPRYQSITNEEIPVIEAEGATIKIIAGSMEGTQGPVKDLFVGAEYFDVTLASGSSFVRSTDSECKAFVFVFEGSVSIGGRAINEQECALLGQGDVVELTTKHASRLLYVAGKPLNEPVAWGGPIVMNTQAELDEAFEELRDGAFIKAGRRVKASEGFYRA